MKTKTTTKTSVFDFRTINTVEAAFERCGYDTGMLKAISSLLPEKIGNSLIAAITLAVIFQAVNDDPKFPDFSNKDQRRYFPWAFVSSGGLGFSDSYCDYDYASAHVGSCLCAETPEKERFIFETFPDLWKAWFLDVKPK
jgi:hypothetical protein